MSSATTDVTGEPSATSSIYIAAPEPDSGKSTIALGLLHLLAASSARVGVFQPIAGSTDHPDRVLDLMLEHTTASLDHDRCVGVSHARVREDPSAALGEIVTRFHDMKRDCDAVVIIGSDDTDVVSPSELAFNAGIAVNLGAPVLLVINARDRTPAAVEQAAQLWLTELEVARATPVAVIANRCDPTKLHEIRDALSGTGVPAWSLPEVPLLTAPTMAELIDALDGQLYSGDPELLQREAMGVLVGGMTAEHILERLTEGLVVIAPADRSEVLLALVTANQAQGFPSLAGIILNGGLLPHPVIDKLVKGLQPTLPLITTRHRTFETAEVVAQTKGTMSVGALRKVDTALAAMGQHIDGPALLDRLRVPIPAVVTPQMFEHRLLDRARANLKHIVLPEGTDDRILRAAGRLLRRRIVELTILGERTAVWQRAAELDVDLAEAQLIDPATSDLLEDFGREYTRLRASKGMTEDRAREIVRDVSYFDSAP